VDVSLCSTLYIGASTSPAKVDIPVATVNSVTAEGCK
jgi:hypothetical protein